MTEPYVATTDRQHCRGESRQGDGLLLVIDNLRPSLYHILVRIGLVFQVDEDRVDRVLQLYRRDVTIPLYPFRHQCRGEVAVRVAHGKSCLGRGVQPIGRISIHTSEHLGFLQVLKFVGTKSGTEIDILRLCPLNDIKYHGDMLGLNDDLLCPCHRG